MLSYQSPMPAYQVMKIEAPVGGRVLVSLPQPTPPLDSRCRGNDECEGIPTEAGMTRPTVVTESIPDRSPGHAVVPIARAGWCRHTKVRKLGALVGGRVLASLPQPAPPLWIPAFAGMTNWGAGMTRRTVATGSIGFRTNRRWRLLARSLAHCQKACYT